MSPELFLTHLKGLLTARPMKGTAAASGNEALDAERAQVLAGDVKNRAENLMIVDLLRNDLGRIARLGSVQVPALYDVARHGDVLQMTSTVQATLRPDVKLIDLFRAVYPCGSITGAPKRRTMEIIHEVEPDARGLYTGAIGWFDPPETAGTVGDFCMSVPIRTLVLAAADESGIRKGELGVGAGIVFDSVASEEYAECALKAQFLTRLPQAFQLVETMRLTQKSCPLLERQCQRMRQSAAYFGLAFEEDAFYQAVREACADAGEGEYSMRVLLGSTGMTVHTATLAPFAQPVRLLRAPATTHSNDLFLRHKTTVRATYDAAWRAAEAQGAFDMLFCNERGDLTEGARSTLLVKLDERWFTPPLSAGVLPG
jgi:para-aminobenzoate synthetase/4-amino-4-deoxychorismate lyase